MTHINKLTDAQIAKFPEYVKRWTDIWMSTEPADRPRAEAAIKAATGCDVDADYLGPVFVSPDEPTENDLTHPEHGSQGFPSGQVCAVVYQRTVDAEQRIQRVRD